MKNLFKKSLCTILLLSIALISTSCSVDKNKNLDKVEKEMKKVVTFEHMKRGNSKDIRRFYNLNIHDYDEIILYKPTSTMDVSEVLMVKVKDKSQIENVEDSIDSRINYQLNNFASYGPKQCDLVNNYELKVKGNFVFFAISQNAEEIKNAFLDSIRN